MKNRLRSIILFFLIFTSYSLLQASEQAATEPATTDQVTTEPAIAAKNTEPLINAILNYQTIKHNLATTNEEKKVARENLLKSVLQLPPLPFGFIDTRITETTINDMEADLLATALNSFTNSQPENMNEKNLDFRLLDNINRKLTFGFNPFDSMYAATTIRKLLNDALKKISLMTDIPEPIKTMVINNLTLITNRSIITPKLPDDLPSPILEKTDPTIEQFINNPEKKSIKNPAELLKMLEQQIQNKEKEINTIFAPEKRAIGYTLTELNIHDPTQKQEQLEVESRKKFFELLKQNQDLILHSLTQDQIFEILSLYCDLSLIGPCIDTTQVNESLSLSKNNGMIFPYYDSNDFENLKMLELLVKKLNIEWVNNENIGQAEPLEKLFKNTSKTVRKIPSNDLLRNSTYFRPTPGISTGHLNYNLLDKALATRCIDLAYILLQNGAKALQSHNTIIQHYATNFPTYLAAYSLWDWKSRPYYNSYNQVVPLNKHLDKNMNSQITKMPGFNMTERLHLFNFNQSDKTLANKAESLQELLEIIPKEDTLRFAKPKFDTNEPPFGVAFEDSQF